LRSLIARLAWPPAGTCALVLTNAPRHLTRPIQFGGGLRTIDEFDPVLWPNARPGRDPVVAPTLPEEASPFPFLRSPNESSSQGVSFDISAHLEEMTSVPDRYRLVSTLIHRTLSLPAARRSPSKGVRHRQPVHEPRDPVAAICRSDEMPMVWHDAVRKKRRVLSFNGLLQNLDEGGVLVRIVEKCEALCRSIEQVERNLPRGVTVSSGHAACELANVMPQRPQGTVLFK